MSHLVQKLRKRWFSLHLSNWEHYHNLLQCYIQDNMIVLNVGCGKGNIKPFTWDNYNVSLIGLDPDPKAKTNPFLTEFHLLESDVQWPIEQESVDIVTARYVLEHIDNTRHFLQNVRRVLKPGGIFIFLTPNLCHPAILMSLFIPHSIKYKLLNRSRKICANDIFPCYYRLNTKNKILRTTQYWSLKKIHFAVKEYEPIGYLDFSLLGFLLACFYHKTMTTTHFEQLFGSSIIGAFQKI